VNRETAADDALKADSAVTKTTDKSDKTLREALADGILSLLHRFSEISPVGSSGRFVERSQRGLHRLDHAPAARLLRGDALADEFHLLRLNRTEIRWTFARINQPGSSGGQSIF
jgi:hypothetical protein